MKKLIFAAAATVFLALPASAEWIFNPDAPPAGRAVGTGDGANLILECGNGGFPVVGIHGHNPGGPEEDFVLQIDENPEDLYFGDCTGAFCWIDMDTMERADAFWNQMREGTTLNIGLLRRGSLGSVPLTGVAQYIAEIEARGCGF